MSATGRGETRTEEAFTPYPLARAVCQLLAKDPQGKEHFHPSTVLEPSAGKGAFVQAVRDEWPNTWIDARDVKVTRELRALESERTTVRERDFLSWASPCRYDLVIGNPPYGPPRTDNAEKHLRQGLRFLTDHGLLAYILRVNFLGGIARSRGLWNEHPPSDVYVLDKRPSFRQNVAVDGSGKKTTRTDSCEYALFVFTKQPPEHATRLGWLRWTPYLERFTQSTVKTLVTG